MSLCCMGTSSEVVYMHVCKYVWVLKQNLFAFFVVFFYAPIWLLRKWEKVKGS